MGLKDKLKNVERKFQNREPVWKGPEQDGITQSLLSRFLVCRERFRLLVVDGLKPADTFNHRLEYGNMWHICEEEQAWGDNWEPALFDYAKELTTKYRDQQEQVEKWWNVCKIQFPIYLEFWNKNPDTKLRFPLSQEETFSVSYKLPSGRTVRLRGKWDSVDTYGTGRSAGVYLQENKTKGDLKEEQLTRQLQFDLQTMFYLVALQFSEAIGNRKLKGVLYNVVRRPLSGGRGTIRQHKPTKKKPAGESIDEFYNRLRGIIVEEANTYFIRWWVEVTRSDIDRFQQEFLNPILEQLCDWWEWIDCKPDNIFSNSVHFRAPFGIWNVLAEGGSHELDEYLSNGSELGLERTDQLFGELV